MSQKTGYKKLERKTYLYYHQDGLLDLMIGACVFAVGFNELTNSTIWGFMAVLSIIAYVPLKNRITFPRLGYVQFKTKRGGVNMLLVGILVMLVLVLALLGILLNLMSGSSGSLVTELFRQGPLVFYTLIGMISFSMAGALLGLHRLYLYTLLTVVILYGGHLLNTPLYLPLLVLAGVILAIGGFLLYRFVRKYPVGSEGDQDVP